MNAINIDAGKYRHDASNEIDGDLFGSGFEFHKFDASIGSDFDIVRDKVGVQLLRYPGGTQTENYFNLATPNATTSTGIVPGYQTTIEVEPLSSFLEYSNEVGARAVIVLPTWRYFSKRTGSAVESAEKEIKSFIRDLFSGKFGAADVMAVEIGNEWFNSRYNWSPAQFADLQAKMVEWIAEVRSELPKNKKFEIWIQTSQQGGSDIDYNQISDNREILNAFSKKVLGEVDGLIDHFYQPQRYDDPMDPNYQLDDWTPTSRIERLEKDGWILDREDSPRLVATEWNLRADRPGVITGLERLSMFCRLFMEMIDSGVSVANFWTTIALGDSNASLSWQGETKLTPTAHVFFIMQNTLPGTHLMEMDGDGRLTVREQLIKNSNGENIGYFYLLEGDGKTVLLLASGSDKGEKFKIGGLRGWGDDATLFGQGVSWLKGHGKIIDADAHSAITTYSHNQLKSNVENGALTLNLMPYEFVAITVSRTEGLIMAADPDNPISDHLVGTPHDDVIKGYGGNDTINGWGGRNVIDGGTGSDRIISERGTSQISGGAGSDTFVLRGGDIEILDFNFNDGDRIDLAQAFDNWSDLIKNVTYSQINQDDRLDAIIRKGGLTVKILDIESKFSPSWFSDDFDFVDAITFKGTTADDKISPGALDRNGRIFSASTPRIEGLDGDDTIRANNQSNTLSGGSGDDLIRGLGGADTIIGGVGNDKLVGHNGNDVILSGSGADTVYGGFGNDSLYLSGDRGIAYAGSGGDRLSISGDGHKVFGGDGDDDFFCKSGDSDLNGGRGNDRFFFTGKNISHTVDTGSGSDFVYVIDFSSKNGQKLTFHNWDLRKDTIYIDNVELEFDKSSTYYEVTKTGNTLEVTTALGGELVFFL